MYSFAQRADTRAVDEPLYAHYLRVSGAQHPGRDEVLASQDSDGERVVREVVLGPCDRPVAFFKMMAHHLVELDLATWERKLLERVTNVLLVRDPRAMLISLAKVLGTPRLEDTGLGAQVEMLDRLERGGLDVPVLDAREILLDPRGVLGELCERVGIAFDERMLSWPAGPKPEDGVWAKHWYAQVHRSTGFEPWTERNAPVPAELRALHEQCQALYERLYTKAIRARPAARARS
jgi:Sulfotransferase domain